MAIKARLGDNSFDLETLARRFRQGDPQVSTDGEGYYLTSSRFDGLMHDGGKLVEMASSLLRKVNGVARVRDPGFRPVRLTGCFSDDAGNSHVVVTYTGSAEVHLQASDATVVVDGQQQAPPPRGPEDIQLSETNPDVDEALRILGKEGPSLSWFDLYKIVEILRRNVGGEKALDAKDWVPAGDIEAVTMSANRADISGDDARHARTSSSPSKRVRPMTLPEAQQVIDQLVARWLDSL